MVKALCDGAIVSSPPGVVTPFPCVGSRCWLSIVDRKRAKQGTAYAARLSDRRRGKGWLLLDYQIEDETEVGYC